MQRTLHLTNGTSVIPRMQDAGIGGAIVAWNDVLHEGPVPAGLGVAALRERRADFLSSCGWGARDRILRELTARDEALTNLQRLDEIVLWLEHDLYDQLQLLQILERLPTELPLRVSAVPDGEYLGTLSPARLASHFAARREVTSAERVAARDAWDAFRAADPRGLVHVLPRVTVLPHLGPALRRHLQQFPSLANGLSRTEQQTLAVLADGPGVVRDVYQLAHHEREEAVFMGDAAFLSHIAPLCRGPHPLLRRARSGGLALDEVIELTDDGRAVLDERADRVTLCGVDRWLGGVQLSGRGPLWRWDAARDTVRVA